MEIMTAPNSPPHPDDTTRKSNLNPSHVAAAALAAVTTAVVGSTLGAAGTLIGAAGASVITTVGTAVYQSSLERSRERVRSLAHRGRPTSQQGRKVDPSHPTAANVPPGNEQLTGNESQPLNRSRRFATLRWGALIVGALGGFALAMMVITGFEWASGEAVGGNGKGTTIGRVVDDQSGPRKPATPPTSHLPVGPTSETPTETTEAPDTTTSPDDGAGVDQSPTTTSDRPAPSEVTPTPPPLIPTRLPGVGG
jgi:hypothetical protein